MKTREVTPLTRLTLRGHLREGVVLAFKHLDLNCHLDFDI